MQAGREVASLLEHPGFEHLKRALRAQSQVVTTELALESAKDSAAFYAKKAGEIKGLADVERVARGVVENAKAAERENRAAEEGGA